MMLGELYLERPDEVLGFVAIQLLVPELMDEPRAKEERGWVAEGVEMRGVVFGTETEGMRMMFVPEELRPNEEEPRLTPVLLGVGDRVNTLEPRELDGITMRALEDPREDDPIEEPREEEPLDLEGLMEPRELLLPREELMEPRELLPRELLPRELLPRELL